MTKKILYQGQPDVTSASVYVSARETTIDAAVVCNTSGATVSLDVWLLPSGGAVANANCIYGSFDVSPASQVSLGLLVNHGLPDGSELHMQASVASALTVTVSGREA